MEFRSGAGAEAQISARFAVASKSCPVTKLIDESSFRPLAVRSEVNVTQLSGRARNKLTARILPSALGDCDFAENAPEPTIRRD